MIIKIYLNLYQLQLEIWKRKLPEY